MTPKRISEIRVEGDIAYVSLTRGYEAVIDAADIPLVEGMPWSAMVTRTGHIYAVRSVAKFRPRALMHRHLTGAPLGLVVDHSDRDGLNNRRSNIRIATTAQNNANMCVSSRSKLGVKGVSVERGGRYSTRIEDGDRKIYLGSFETIAEASAAYFGAARVLWGDFARKK